MKAKYSYIMILNYIGRYEINNIKNAIYFDIESTVKKLNYDTFVRHAGINDNKVVFSELNLTIKSLNKIINNKKDILLKLKEYKFDHKVTKRTAIFRDYLNYYASKSTIINEFSGKLSITSSLEKLVKYTAPYVSHKFLTERLELIIKNHEKMLRILKLQHDYIVKHYAEYVI